MRGFHRQERACSVLPASLTSMGANHMIGLLYSISYDNGKIGYML